MVKSKRALIRKSLDYVGKNYRYLVEDPSFFVMKYAARFERFRTWSGSADPHADDHLLGVDDSVLVPTCSLTDVVDVLRAEGYFVGLTLRPDLALALAQRARATTCYADRDPERPLPPGFRERAPSPGARAPRVASYLDQQEGWPEFQTLLHDRALRAIAHAYLGHLPVYLRSDLTWSFPSAGLSHRERLSNAQVFHCDINDFRTLKFFFYLTDVDLGSGPHAYLKKSPMPRTLHHQLLGQRCASLSEEALLASYPENDVVTICGRAGTGFAGDPYYFHRGTSPTTDTRLLLQLEFGIRRYRTWYNES